jgi:hypothetical protein
MVPKTVSDKKKSELATYEEAKIEKSKNTFNASVYDFTDKFRCLKLQ